MLRSITAARDRQLGDAELRQCQLAVERGRSLTGISEVLGGFLDQAFRLKDTAQPVLRAQKCFGRACRQESGLEMLDRLGLAVEPESIAAGI